MMPSTRRTALRAQSTFCSNSAEPGWRHRPHRAWYFVDYEQQRQKNPITAINNGFSDVDETSFGVPDGTALLAPLGVFPTPVDFIPPSRSTIQL